MIEYICRQSNKLRLIKDSDLSVELRTQIETFLKHDAFISVDIKTTVPGCTMWQRIDARVLEMKDRRRKLTKTIAQKQGNISHFDKQFEKFLKNKAVMLAAIDDAKLEEMLKEG